MINFFKFIGLFFLLLIPILITFIPTIGSALGCGFSPESDNCLSISGADAFFLTAVFGIILSLLAFVISSKKSQDQEVGVTVKIYTAIFFISLISSLVLLK